MRTRDTRDEGAAEMPYQCLTKVPHRMGGDNGDDSIAMGAGQIVSA